MESLRGIAYKSVRYFHFEPRGDGDAHEVIRKNEILRSLLRIAYKSERCDYFHYFSGK